MDPISLIIAALVAGASAGAQDFATDAIKDAYAGLKKLIKVRFNKSVTEEDDAAGIAPKGAAVEVETVLASHELEPETWEKPMRKVLKTLGADHDAQILAAAQALLDATGAAGQSDKYRVDARGSQGVQIGDRGTQKNNFAAPPAAAPKNQ